MLKCLQFLNKKGYSLTSKLLRFFTPKWGTEGGIILFLLSWLRAFSPKDPFKHGCYISQSSFAFYLEVCNADSHVSRSKISRFVPHPSCPHSPPVPVTSGPCSGVAPSCCQRPSGNISYGILCGQAKIPWGEVASTTLLLFALRFRNCFSGKE